MQNTLVSVGQLSTLAASPIERFVSARFHFPALGCSDGNENPRFHLVSKKDALFPVFVLRFHLVSVPVETRKPLKLSVSFLSIRHACPFFGYQILLLARVAPVATLPCDQGLRLAVEVGTPLADFSVAPLDCGDV